MAEESKFAGMDIQVKTPSDLKRKDIIVKEEGAETKLIEVSVITKSKPGKHGSAKFNICGVNLASGKNYEFTEGAKANLHIATLQKHQCMLIDINETQDEFIVFNDMTMETHTYSLKLIPAESLQKIKDAKEALPNAQIKFNMIDTQYLVNITDININATE